jgi:membrane fusion protein
VNISEEQNKKINSNSALSRKESSDTLTFLFREQCIEGISGEISGKTIKHQRPNSKKRLSLFIAFMLLALLFYVYNGHYTRKVTIKGIITPQDGTLHSVSPANAVVEEVLIREGDSVQAGQRILRLSKENISSSGATFTLVNDKIKKQILLLQSRKMLIALKHEQEIQELTKKIERFNIQKKILEQELSHQQDLVTNKKQLLQRISILVKEKAVSIVTHEEAKQEVLLASIDLQKLQRSIQGVISDIQSIPSEIELTTITLHMTLSEMENELLLFNRELLNNESALGIYITAPITGTVTALNTSTGQHVVVGSTLASTYPLYSNLQAHLYIPPEGIGFVEAEQTAAIRLTAFPFQKFGVMKGRVLRVSLTPYQTADLPHQLSDVLDPNRTYYKAIVELEQQHIETNGKQRALKPGLVLEADLMLEKRKLYEWLLAPIYSFTRKSV